jgi:hypothetical protein
LYINVSRGTMENMKVIHITQTLEKF